MEILTHGTIFQRGHLMKAYNASCQGTSVKNPLHLSMVPAELETLASKWLVPFSFETR